MLVKRPASSDVRDLRQAIASVRCRLLVPRPFGGNSPTVGTRRAISRTSATEIKATGAARARACAAPPAPALEARRRPRTFPRYEAVDCLTDKRSRGVVAKFSEIVGELA